MREMTLEMLGIFLRALGLGAAVLVAGTLAIVAVFILIERRRGGG